MRLFCFMEKKEEQSMDYCNMAKEIPASPIRDMMLNSPCNPTGGVISKEALKEIAR